MMTNLFSIFDPSNSSMTKFNWIIMFMYTFILPYQYLITTNRIMKFFKMKLFFLFKEIKSVINMKQFINIYLMMSIFMILFYNNFGGLMPYSFTPTSHICITIPLALSLWLSFMIYGFVNNFISMLSHMIPMGTPMSLSFFICLIETISMLSRPVSLSIRLAANMIAGHLLLNLLSSMIYSLNMWSFLMLPMTSLLCLEILVSIIQSYVFMLLTILYLNEIK